MFSFDDTLKFNNKEIDVFTIGELLVDMISNDYDDSFDCSQYTKHFVDYCEHCYEHKKIRRKFCSCHQQLENDGLGDFNQSSKKQII